MPINDSKKDLELILSTGKVIDLPMQSWSLRSHIKNVNYAIDAIKKAQTSSSEVVIVYYNQRSLGVREVDYRLMEKSKAEVLKEENPRFAYVTLQGLESMKTDFENGRYVLRDGLIVGLNPDFV